MEASVEGYKPPAEYQEDQKDRLVDISLTDSTELWLIQWPINQLQPNDFQGKELTLNLHNDGQLANFKSSSGKLYDMVSFAAQEPDATVFLASGSESKVVGKISRRVSLIHYPEPNELEKPSSKSSILSQQRSAGWSLSRGKSGQSSPAQDEKHRSSGLTGDISHSNTTPSSGKQRSSVSGTSSVKGHPSKQSKRRHIEGTSPSGESSRSVDKSMQDSGMEGRSDVSSLGYSEHSHERNHKGRRARSGK